MTYLPSVWAQNLSLIVLSEHFPDHKEKADCNWQRLLQNCTFLAPTTIKWTSWSFSGRIMRPWFGNSSKWTQFLFPFWLCLHAECWELVALWHSHTHYTGSSLKPTADWCSSGSKMRRESENIWGRGLCFMFIGDVFPCSLFVSNEQAH